jgi:hypothetical protein
MLNNDEPVRYAEAKHCPVRVSQLLIKWNNTNHAPWFVLLHFPHWCIITGHGLYCFTSCFVRSSLRAWFVLIHVILHLFILTVHTLCCFTSCFTGSSLLCMVCIVSLLASLVHHHWTWFVLFDYMLHLFFLTWNGLHCFTWIITGSFLLAIVCITVRMNRWSMTESTQTMPSNEDPTKHDVKQYKPCPVMMHQWGKCNSTNHVQ